MTETPKTTLTNMLQAVTRIVSANNEIAARTEWKFNVFRLCGITRNEVWHSHILAEFLNPKGTHGFGNAFLESFLHHVGQDHLIKQLEGTIVRTEHSFISYDTETTGRLDILLQNSSEKWAIVIENKIDADEGDGQIAKYQRWLDDKTALGYDRAISTILFLTLDGHPSWSKDGECPVLVSPISYSFEICGWLTDCIQIAAERPFVRETLRQYLNLVKQLTEQGMENSCNEEIGRLLENDAPIENLNAAMQLFMAKDMIFERVGQMIANAIKRRIEDHSSLWEFEKNEVTGSFSEKDHFLCVRHKSGFKVRIAPDSANYRGFYVGQTTKDDESEEYDELRKAVVSKDKRWKSHSKWPIWKYLTKKNWDVQTLQAFLNGDNTIVDDATSILKDLGSLIDAARNSNQE